VSTFRAGFAHQTKIVAAEHAQTDAADGLHILVTEERLAVSLAVCLRDILDLQDRPFTVVVGFTGDLATGPYARRAGHEFARYRVLGAVGDLHGSPLSTIRPPASTKVSSATSATDGTEVLMKTIPADIRRAVRAAAERSAPRPSRRAAG